MQTTTAMTNQLMGDYLEEENDDDQWQGRECLDSLKVFRIDVKEMDEANDQQMDSTDMQSQNQGNIIPNGDSTTFGQPQFNPIKSKQLLPLFAPALQDHSMSPTSPNCLMVPSPSRLKKQNSDYGQISDQEAHEINLKQAKKLSNNIIRHSIREKRRQMNNQSEGKASQDGNQGNSNSSSQKVIEQEGIRVFDPAQFEYYQQLGMGANGKVRKCMLILNQTQNKEEQKENDQNTNVDQYQIVDVNQSDRTVGSSGDHQEESPMLQEFSAVKLQSKYQLITNGYQEHLFNEIQIMTEISNPFMLKMKGVAQDKRIMYMYVDYMKNGDLLGVLNQFIQIEKKKMPIEIGRFYAAQIVVCFEYLHNSKSVIYRDLKPENILVSDNGSIKLADFGFVKKMEKWDRTYTICGTPEYMAPEILLNQGYSHPVDWYALGILMYELLYGRPPFMDNDPMKVLKMITKDRIRFTKSFDPDAKSLIKSLTEKDVTMRYGNISGGIQKIKNHAFFKDIDWQALCAQNFGPTGIQIPYVPPPNPSSQHNPELDNLNRMSYKQLDECHDNRKYPPIKVEKDKFLNWF